MPKPIRLNLAPWEEAVQFFRQACDQCAEGGGPKEVDLAKANQYLKAIDSRYRFQVAPTIWTFAEVFYQEYTQGYLHPRKGKGGTKNDNDN